MTYSIVAYDPTTGELGVGVHSKVFSLGSTVPWIRADLGAVATQSLVNVSLGPKALELLEDGRTPQQIMEHFRRIDEGIELRQLGIYSVKHGSFAFTGDKCIPSAAHVIGKNYSCQGNLLSNDDVIPSMSHGFENASGFLVEKIMTALESAEAAGGDSRGSQSAIIMIDQLRKGKGNFGDRKIDLRVEDHENPISTLRGYVNIQIIYSKIRSSLESNSLNLNVAIDEIEAIISKSKDRPFDEAWLILGTLYFNVNDFENASRCVSICLDINPHMKNIIKHYPTYGLGFNQEFLTSSLV
ncbi:MAG: DUF1028 domain-containing protein [Candidatus Heimdallarchaeota archaeon]|nr:DUF1028 domain-containing protein [Candidatus Heimdallarchaeota archaeon]